MGRSIAGLSGVFLAAAIALPAPLIPAPDPSPRQPEGSAPSQAPAAPASEPGKTPGPPGADVARSDSRPAPSGQGPGQVSYYQYLLGKMRRYSGDLGDAAEHFSRAASADDSSAIRIELAETYLRMGDIEKATEQARLATERSPEDIAAHRALIDAYLAGVARGSDAGRTTALAIAEMQATLVLAPEQSDLRVTLGRLLLQEDRAREAVEQFRAVRAAEGDSPQLAMLIARSLLRDGQTDAAESELRAALSASPRNYEALSLLAQIAENGNDWNNAAALYAQLADAKPSDAEPRARQGYALLRAGRDEEAVGVLREACAIDASSRGARELLIRALRGSGRRAEALGEIDILLQYQPGDAALLIQAGRIREAREEYESALESFRRAAAAAESAGPAGGSALEPGARAALRLEIATLEIETRDPPAALRTLESVPLDASDLGLDAAALRVRAYAAAGQSAEALAAARRFMEMEPEASSRGPLLLLQARLAGARGDSAVRAIEEFHPQNRPLQDLVAAADLLRRAGAGEAAVEVLDRAVAAHPQDAALLFSLGALHGQLGATRKSEALMERVILLDPRNALALNYLGYALAERGKDLARAEELVRRALQEDPRNGAYLDSLGWVLYKAGRLDEAEQSLMRAADLLAGDATVREHLGDLYARKGDAEKAQFEWRSAQGLKPEDPVRLRKKILEASGSR